jgi:predicted Mrr-cat superfamily restriction endonuclease
MTRPDTPPAVWVVRAGRRGRYLPAFRDTGCVALPGHGVGDLTSLTTQDVRKAVREAGANARKAAVLDMFRELRVWDGVLTPYSYDGVLWFGRVTGPYRYDPNRIPGLAHTVPVKWLGWTWRRDVPSPIDRVLGASIEIFKPTTQQPLLELDVWTDRAGSAGRR